MRSLVVERNAARFAAARLASAFGSGRGVESGLGPLRLLETEAPALPDPSWCRVSTLLSGICGSDLATLDGRSSRYFEHVVSFPFVPGHEVVGSIEDPGASGLQAGDRVVLEPVLGCVARGIDPPCPACAEGRLGDCEQVAFGHVRPGLQTGYCADTGGGWSASGLVAHPSQLHRVPDELDDATAVMVEPTACAVHAAFDAGVTEGATVAVLGAGTLGLAFTAALSRLAATGRLPTPGTVLVGARYPHQRRLAVELGATDAVPPDQLPRAVRRRSRSLALGRPSTGAQQLTGGAEVVVDCVGSAASIAQCLEMVRPRGRIVLVGMPGSVHVDLAPLWHREVTLAGTYAYGTERLADGSGARTFDLAFDVVAAQRLGRLVSATYPLERFEEAVAHAAGAGRRGAVKIAFDLRRPRHRPARPGAGPHAGREPA